ncbi:hypothetical protein [Streptomyces halstedii]|uniref:hypothetical protein n=1 Tax=Streptomyces halstedii TaxID=1944 RepID=UPI00345F54E2
MTHPHDGTREAPLNLDAATRLADEALSFQIGTTTRLAMDDVTVRLVEQVEAFFEEGLPEDESEAAAQRKEIRTLLERCPDGEDPAFSAWTYMRALGRVLRRHVTQYRHRHEHQAQKANGQEGNGISPEPVPGQPSGTYRVPSGLATAVTRRRLSLTGGGAQ